MKNKTKDIILTIIVFLVILLPYVIAFVMGWATPHGIDPTQQETLEYERGYMDGFREGMSMCDIDYGTIKLERKGGGE